MSSSLDIFVELSICDKVTYCLDRLHMEFTMLGYWKGGLGNTGGLAAPLSCFLLLLRYLLHWHA